MKFNFREWLKELNEAVKEKQFKINVYNKEYTVVRDEHLIKKRKGDPKPKDFKMTKKKYEIIFHNLDKINVNEPFSFTWKEKGKSYIISADLKGSTITVFGAIMNSSDSEDKLYPSVTNRANVEAPIINDENTN